MTTKQKPSSTPAPKKMGNGKGNVKQKPTSTPAPKARKDKRGGIDSTDRWTSNGYGLKSEPVSAERKARIAQINKELAAGKKKPAEKKR